MDGRLKLVSEAAEPSVTQSSRVKRARDSVCEDPTEVVKRRCVEGNENVNPLKSCFGSPVRSCLRETELQLKPDTPAVLSVQSRVKSFSHKQSGDGEFRSRVERFEALPMMENPVVSTPRCQVVPGLTRSMQERLQSTDTPSSSRMSRIRQERENELQMLRSQSIADNMWLKRSMPDPSAAEVPQFHTLPRMTPSNRKLQWPPQHLSYDDSRMAAATTHVADCEDSETDTDVHKEKLWTAALPPAAHVCGEEEESPVAGVSVSAGADKALLTDAGREASATLMCQDQVPTWSHVQGEEVSVDAVQLDTASEVQEEVHASRMIEKVLNSTVNETTERDEESEEEVSFPPSCVLSPLSKAVECVVTPLKPCVHPSESTPGECAPLYSIHAYRTQQQSSQQAPPRVTAGVDPPNTNPTQTLPTKQQIKMLNHEAARLQTIISQTMQALNCCTDQGHGKGSLEEAEAEKLLLISSEKRAALLAEVSRLRMESTEENRSVSGARRPCGGTLRITNVRLPLKAEFVRSSRMHTGPPLHYFFVLFRYGGYRMAATPLASAADLQSGDMINFSSCITLQDIHADFEIDVEIYSLFHAGNSFNIEHNRAKLTPKKFLNTITRSSNSSVSSATLTSVSSLRSSNFSLVGAHKLTLASVGKTNFVLDKMKFDGKIRRLLGDEFQDKVPFLFPLEGNINIQLECEGQSAVQHKGFLTVFEDVFGFGAWQRRWFVLDRTMLSFWNYPSEECNKPPGGVISLSGYTHHQVQLVKQNCARPNTFELLEEMESEALCSLDKHCWFSADTQEECEQWMEKLNQALLDLSTWSRGVPSHQ